MQQIIVSQKCLIFFKQNIIFIYLFWILTEIEPRRFKTNQNHCCGLKLRRILRRSQSQRLKGRWLFVLTNQVTPFELIRPMEIRGAVCRRCLLSLER